MASTARRGFWYGWVILGVTLLCYWMVVGLAGISAYPVVMPQMLAERGWTRGDTLLATTVATWLGVFLAPLAGWAIDRWGARVTLFWSALASGGVYFILTQVTELWQWLVVWGIIRAPLIRLASIMPFMTITNQWFNLRRGFAMGTMLMAGGLGGFVGAPFFTWVMQASQSWQVGWGVAGVIMAAAGIVFMIFARSRPSDMGTWPDGLSPEEAQRAREAALARQASGQRAIATTYRSPINWTLGAALRTPAFYWTTLIWLGYQVTYTFATNHGILQLTRTGRFSSMEAAVSWSIYNIVSVPFRFVMGWLTDRIEARFIALFGIVAGMGAIVALWAVTPGNYFTMYSYAVLGGINLGVCFSSINILMANYFGPGNYATINSTITGTIAAIFLGFLPAGGGYIWDITGSYNLAFIVLGVCQAIGVVACLLGTPPQPKEVTTPRPAA